MLKFLTVMLIATAWVMLLTLWVHIFVGAWVVAGEIIDWNRNRRWRVAFEKNNKKRKATND